MISRKAWRRIHTIYEAVQAACDVPAIVKPLKFDGELIAGWLLLVGLFVAGVGIERILSSTPSYCRVNSAYPLMHSDADVAMIVKSGMSCPVLVRTGDAIINDLKIISAPQHGVVVDRGRTGVIYRAGRGFYGEDFFAFELRGKVRAHEIVSIVRVAVTVGDGMTLARLR